MYQCLLNTDIIMCELGEYVRMHVTESPFYLLLTILKSLEQGFCSATFYEPMMRDIYVE